MRNGGRTGDYLANRDILGDVRRAGRGYARPTQKDTLLRQINEDLRIHLDDMA